MTTSQLETLDSCEVAVGYFESKQGQYMLRNGNGTYRNYLGEVFTELIPLALSKDVSKEVKEKACSLFHKVNDIYEGEAQN